MLRTLALILAGGDSPALRRTFDFFYQVYVERELNTAELNYATDIGAAVRAALAADELGILASGSWEDACLWDCKYIARCMRLVHGPHVVERAFQGGSGIVALIDGIGK